MKNVIHRALDRGFQNHGWLQAAHSFSFANYFDPTKTHFGLLRVLNDDSIAGGMGFGMHGHDNMEIVTIPLKGALAHKDSLGSEGVISYGEIQIMSAGSGIKHSEFNASATEEVSLLQIWVFPKERNIQPRYDQQRFNPAQAKNNFMVLVSPHKQSDGMWINQDAYFSIADADQGIELNYTINHPGNGAYVFMIEGSAVVDETELSKRDAMGVWEAEGFKLKAIEASKILVIEVPMH